MAKHYNEAQLATVVEMIEEWDGMPSWDDLITAGIAKFGYCPTRAALYRHDTIKDAWLDKKENGGKKVPKALQAARRKIRKLEAENERLQALDAEHVDQFLRWQHNASKATQAPLTKEQLDFPIPKPKKLEDII